MCKDAKTLINDFKKGVDFFKVENYPYQNHKGEIAEVAKYCHQGNAKAILNILKNKNTKKYFEIKHPLYDDITLRAVYSVANYCNNYVFFVDSSNTFCLCIVQNCNFVNFFITEQTIFRVSYVWEGAMKGSIGYLCSQSRMGNILPQYLTYKESKFAYNLYHYRPAHYFGHMLVNYIHLQDKPVFQNQCFFLPKNTEITTEADKVLFYPMTYLHQDLTQSNSLVFGESLQRFNALVAPQDKLDKFGKKEISEAEINQLTLNNICDTNKYSLTLWLGIPGERRIWLEQWEGIPLILKNLSRYFPSIKVYVDGMTAYDGERIEVKDNLEAFWRIVENTKEAFEVGDSRHCEQSEANQIQAQSGISINCHCEARSNEAIHNVAYFKDSIAKSRVDKMIDCHENQRFSRNDANASILESRKDTNPNQSAFKVADALDSRHCEARSNEAIHNVEHQTILHSEIKDDGLPRVINHARNDKRAESKTEGQTLDDRFAQCGQTATQCAPRDSQIFRNDKEATTASLQGTSETSNEANHNAESHNQSQTTNNDDSKNSCVIYGTKGEQIAFKSLSGYDYRTKICYCVMCDIVISETSTTALTPFNFCKKPGVAFYCIYQADNRVHINMARDFAKQIPHLKVPSPCYHTYEGGARSGTCFNYHFPPEHFYNLAAQSLEELSLEGKLTSFGKDNPLKMHRLAVPPVELYAKKHALEQKTKIKLHSNQSTKRLLKEISYQKQLLKIESLELDNQLKQLQIKSYGCLPPSPTPKIPQGSAKDRIHNHLAYKLGQALILNSKSLWGYIRMPYVLSFIKESHRKEIAEYEEKVARNPSLKLPKLESYPDYQESLKEKECLTYKLGKALMQADKDWLKGGYLRFYLQEVPRLKREFRERKK